MEKYDSAETIALPVAYKRLRDNFFAEKWFGVNQTILLAITHLTV
ncbi:TPA: hypothetical protein ACGTRQ_004199 [Vibrio parahaemolyticus]